MAVNPKDLRKAMSGGYSAKSFLIHGRFQIPEWDYQHHIIPPMTASTAYCLSSVERGAEGFAKFANPEIDRMKTQPIYIYERLDEPSRGMLEENLAYAEGGETAVCFASGMAAISGALGVTVKSGEHIISSKTIYGCTYSLLANWYPRYNIAVDFVDMTDVSNIENFVKPNTRVVYLETPANPTLHIIDISAVKKVVDKFNESRKDNEKIVIIADNTFATPYCQRPIDLGVDIVVHSLTKNISGFGTDMGGVVVAPKKYDSALLMYRKDFGGALASRVAWSILVYGLPTLFHRMKQEQENAIKIAEFLSMHPKVERVSYPGLESHPQYEIAKRQMVDWDGNFAPGNMIFFVLKGSPEEAKEKGRQMMNYIANNALSITLAVSLGQIRTLIEHPASMTHAAIPLEEQLKGGIDQGGIRMSIGLEDAKDIIKDLNDALKSI